MRISVIMPTKNSDKYLERAIKSVLNQNYADLEIIATDGGSTDNTISILNKYNITIGSRSDTHPGDGINKVFPLLTGDIMGWANYDDEVLPGAYEAVSNTFKDPTVDWVYSPLDLLNMDGTHNHTMGDQDYQPTVESMLIQNTIPGTTCYFRISKLKSILGNSNLMDVQFHHADDYELWMRLLKNGLVPHKIEQKLSLFHFTGFNNGGSGGSEIGQIKDIYR